LQNVCDRGYIVVFLGESDPRGSALLRALKVNLVVALALCALAPAAEATTVRSFPITAGGPHAVAPGNDGSVFVGARDCGYLGRFDPTSNAFNVFLSQPTLPCTPDESSAGRGAFSAVQGPDDKLYFTVYDSDPVDGVGSVARVNPNGSGFESVLAGVHPMDITIGPDNNVWFTLNGPPGKVGRINPATFKVETFNVPGAVQGPRGIVAGGDGNLYVLGGEADVIWRVTTAAVPVITPVASGLDGPSFGELGPDGRVWLTLFEGEGVTSFDPAGLGVGPAIAIPGQPWDVAFADGKAYATRFNANSIAEIVPGQPGFASLPLPTSNGSPAFIARASDGNLYAAGNGENTLFQVIPDRPQPQPQPQSQPAPPTPVRDSDPPNTKLVNKPEKRSHDRTPTFKARSDEPGSRFRCKLDRGRFKPCAPRKTFGVKPGSHVVRVAAVDPAGNVDPTPARFRFTVLG
jgi:streptogramin lyase